MASNTVTVAQVLSTIDSYLKLAYIYAYPACTYIYDILQDMVKQFRKDWDRVMSCEDCLVPEESKKDK